jgi:hypothetical protein
MHTTENSQISSHEWIGVEMKTTKTRRVLHA